MSYSSEVLADSPNIYWRLNETSGNPADSSGNGVTGTANGGITYRIAGPLTDLNCGVQLDGTTGYFTAPDGVKTDLGDVLTVEAFVNTPAGIPGTYPIVGKGSNGYEVYVTGNGKIVLNKENISTIVSSTVSISDGCWHHVVVTKNGATVKIYIDGNDCTGTVTNATLADTAQPLAVGRNGEGAAVYYIGRLDEFALYPTALSQARVVAHFQAATADATFVSMAGSLPDVSLTWSPTTAPNATPVYVNMIAADGSLFSRDIAISRGRVDELSRFETATLRATLDNRMRDFDPNYASGRFYPNVKPMRRVRLLARWPKGPGGSIYARFIGFTGDELPQQYKGPDAIVPITAYDGLGVLAMAKLSSTFTRPAELSGARVAAVLDQVGWPAADRTIGTGVATLGAYSAAVGVSALQHLQDVQDAEGGTLFVDRGGLFVFQDRHYRNLSERTSRQTFATVATSESGLHYADVDVRYGGRLWNGAQITPASGTVQEWNDATSQTDNYPRVYSRSLPLSSDADALALAQYVVQFNKTPTLRCYSMRLSGASEPTRLWPALLNLEISHHVTVRVTPPAQTGTYSFEQSIEGCQETITPSAWTMVFPMSPADLSTYWTLDTSTLGDNTVLAY